ncbi:MAG: molybdopterin cofactor-binding domain-containing protein [Devosia sp.]
MSDLPAAVKAHPLISQWISLAHEGRVGVTSGKVEIGQGIGLALRQIAADELGVGIEAVHIVQGDTRVCPDEGVTAGSLSVAMGGMAVRRAAAAARAHLLTHAATLLQAKREDLAIADGVVARRGVETDLTLWGLAREVDLAVPITLEDTPKSPDARTIAGRAASRDDLIEKLMGRVFIHDMVLEGMVHGRPIHTDALSCDGAGIDRQALAARPGVVSVVEDGDFLAVLATREEDAVAASRWAHGKLAPGEPDPQPIGSPQSLNAHEGSAVVVVDKGDPLPDGDTIVESFVSRPFLAHGSIGPSCALARWDGDRLTVWSHSQSVFRLKAALAALLRHPEEAIDVIHRQGAGCYGHNGADDVAADAALMARTVPGRPVRVVWSRADEFAAGPLGAPMATRARAMLGPDGRVSAVDVAVTSAPHSIRSGPQSPTFRAATALKDPPHLPAPQDIPAAQGGGAERNATPLYDIPHQRVAKTVVPDLGVRTSALRSLGAHLNIVAIETLMDAAADAAGEDAAAYRIAHLTDPRARAVIERATKVAGWPQTAGEGEAWGLGFGRYKNVAGYCAIAALIHVEEAVQVRRVVAAVDVGEAINPDGVVAQVEGGIIQSMSWTLREAMAFHGTKAVSRDFEAYPIATFSQVPEIEVHLINRPEMAPLGCGEVAQGPMAAAIVCGVQRVLGVPMGHLPLTRERILQALSEAV